MKKILAAILLMTSIVAWSNEFNDGVRAHGKRDYKTALQKFTPLAEQGDADAQFALGLMYSNGQGVAQDYVLAHMWLNLASAKGDAEAANRRNIVSRKMTQEQIAEAQKMARECMSQKFKNCN